MGDDLLGGIVDLGEEESLLASLQHRLIDVRHMRGRIRVLMALTLLQVTAVAGLLVFGNQLPADVSVGYAAAQTQTAVPVVIYILTICSLFFGTLLAVGAALMMDWRVRMPVLLCVTIVLGSLPFFRLLQLSEFSRYVIPGHEQTIRWFQIGTLGVLWFTALVVPTGDATLRVRRMFGWVATLIALYYGLEALNWLTIPGGTGLALFSASLSEQAYFLPIALSVVYYWSGTDIAEWGEALGVTLIASFAPLRRSRFVPLLLLGMLALVIAAVFADLADRLRLSQLDVTSAQALAPTLAVVVGVALAAAICARIAGITTLWPERIPARTLLDGAIFLFCAYQLIPMLGMILQSTSGHTNSTIAMTDQIGTVIVLVIGLAIALYRLARYHSADGARGMGALLVALTALIALPTSVPTALAGLGIPVQPLPHYFDALQLVITLGAALYGLYAVIRRGLSVKSAEPLVSALLLVVEAEAIHWAMSLPQALARLGLTTGAAASGVFLLAILWDVVTSGKETTNGDSPAYPREARITLYLAYTMIAATALLYLASVRIAIMQTPVGSPGVVGTYDALSSFGMVYLGIPMIAQVFIQRVGRWHARFAPAPQRAPARVAPRFKLPPRIATIVTSIALYTPLLLLAGLYGFLTSPSYGQYQGYGIHSPGPYCTIGSPAVWTFSKGLRLACQPDGMRMALASGQTMGGVGFHTTSNHFPDSYAVGVTVDFSSLSQGCAAVLTYTAVAGAYVENFVCPDGEFGVLINEGASGFYSVVLGVAPQTHVYTMKALVKGNMTTITVNGLFVSAPIYGYGETDGIDLYLMGRPDETIEHPGSVTPVGYAVFRDFTYEPV